MQRLTLKHVRQLIPLVSLPYFIGFEGVPYSGLLLMQIAEVNLGLLQQLKWSYLIKLPCVWF